jgi:regulator of sirC expression with transglutaminase-like and TPR domain
MIAQHDALLRLLDDDDEKTLALLREQLVARGHTALPELRELLAVAPATAARNLGTVIAGIEARDADAIFEEFCAGPGPDEDLEEGAWRLAAAFQPGEDSAPQRARLDAWGAEVARRLVKADSAVDRIETLVEYLAHEVRLLGNVEDYYNINNSLLPEVIDTRLGNPITLSLIYILVGARAGIPISGAGLPGHFLIRHGTKFYDPFHGGRNVTFEECQLRADQQRFKLSAAHFEPVPPRYFLLRTLNNIRSIAVESDPLLAAKVLGWIGTLTSPRAGT